MSTYTDKLVAQIKAKQPVVASSITGQLGNTPTKAPTQPTIQQPTETQAPGWIGQPKKVATTQNPVITRSAPAPTPMTPPQTDITSWDDNQIKDFVAWAELNPTELSQEDMFKLKRGQQILQDRAYQQTTIDPYQDQLKTEQELRAQKEKELQDRNAQLTDARRKELELTYGKRITGAQEAGQKTMSAAQGVLSFSGFGRSTYAAEKQAEIQQKVNENISILNAERDYAMAQYEAELRGATAEELAGYDANISALRQKSAEFSTQLAQQMNEYNMQTAASYEERINNVLQLAQSLEIVELTPGQQEEAGAYASLLLDNEGNINDKLLADIPPILKGYALRKASEIKANMPKKFEAPKTEKGDDGSIYAWNEETGELEKVIQGSGPKSEWKSDGIGGFWRTNPITGEPEERTGQGNPPSQGPSQTPSGQPTKVTDLIQKREGFREKAYWDVNGWAVGYGQHNINGQPVTQNTVIDRATADADLSNRVENAKFNNLITVPLSDSQRAALYSLEHNVGGGVWGFPNGKKIIDEINKGNLQKASDILANSGIGTTNAATKEVMPGLVNRRREEASLLMIPNEFEQRNQQDTQGKQYNQQQKNILEAMKDKSIGETEIKLLKQQGLNASDVYDYNASQKGNELTDDQRAMFSNQIAGFRANKQVQAFEDGITNYENIAASLDDTSGVGDMAGIFQFMKSLDPQSVVRETEFNTAASSAGVVNKLGNTFARLSEGKLLTAEQAKAFKKLAKKYIENRAKTYDRLYGDMERAFANSKIDKSYLPTKASDSIKQTTQSNTVTKVTPKAKSITAKYGY